jgi:hypothetical protein
MTVSAAAALRAQATVEVQRVIVPFEDDLDPCSGEALQLAGQLLITERLVTDTLGGVHTTYVLVPQHIRGSNADGEVFIAVGGEREHISLGVGDLPFTGTFTTIFNLVSLGDGDNFVSRATFHVTVNENGVATAEVDNVQVECRG